MKKLTFLAVALIVIATSCKKEEKAASPSTTPPVTLSYTSADSAISGNWIFDLTEAYIDGVLALSIPHSDPVYCHLDLQLAPFTLTSSAAPDWKTCIFGLGCTNIETQWRLNTGMLEVDNGTLYTIVSLSATNLILQYGSMSVGNNAQKLYFHK